jgi:hypothetical protein
MFPEGHKSVLDIPHAWKRIIERGDLRDGWEYQISEFKIKHGDGTMYYQAVVLKEQPDTYHEDPSDPNNPPVPGIASVGYPVNLIFYSLEDARLGARAFFVGLAYWKGYPDVTKMGSYGSSARPQPNPTKNASE